MSNETTGALHLPDLSIRNFRGISKLLIERLGRVTLLAGGNGVGKSTVLEAVRVYAARGERAELAQVLLERDEFALNEFINGSPKLDFPALFYGRTAPPNRRISIGPKSDINTLGIEAVPLEDVAMQHQELLEDLLPEYDPQVFKITFNGFEYIWPWSPEKYNSRLRFFLRQQRQSQGRLKSDEQDGTEGIKCLSLGPGLPNNDQISDWWDNVILTPDEPLALDVAHLVDERIDGVAMVGQKRGHQKRGNSRRVIAKLRGHGKPVPLKSLGVGITRLFNAAVAMANCKNGFLLVDEVENGIHHSIQHRFWDLIIRAAKHHNVQVIATTQNHDCIQGFAKAATSIDDARGCLVRLEQNESEIRAVEYTEEELRVLGTQNFEVR